MSPAISPVTPIIDHGELEEMIPADKIWQALNCSTSHRYRRAHHQRFHPRHGNTVPEASRYRLQHDPRHSLSRSWTPCCWSSCCICWPRPSRALPVRTEVNTSSNAVIVERGGAQRFVSGSARSRTRPRAPPARYQPAQAPGTDRNGRSRRSGNGFGSISASLATPTCSDRMPAATYVITGCCAGSSGCRCRHSSSLPPAVCRVPSACQSVQAARSGVVRSSTPAPSVP